MEISVLYLKIEIFMIHFIFHQRTYQRSRPWRINTKCWKIRSNNKFCSL